MTDATTTTASATPRAGGETRTPNSIDCHVGAKIRIRRRQLNLSQDALAHTLGLTFQQVQKYERGANRVSASKLYEIARTLQVPVSHFFEGIDADLVESPTDTDMPAIAYALDKVPELRRLEAVPVWVLRTIRDLINNTAPVS